MDISIKEIPSPLDLDILQEEVAARFEGASVKYFAQTFWQRWPGKTAARGAELPDDPTKPYVTPGELLVINLPENTQEQAVKNLISKHNPEKSGKEKAREKRAEREIDSLLEASPAALRRLKNKLDSL